METDGEASPGDGRIVYLDCGGAARVLLPVNCEVWMFGLEAGGVTVWSAPLCSSPVHFSDVTPEPFLDSALLINNAC